MASHHCYSVGGEQLLWSHGGEVGDVGHGVHQGHQWDGDVDGKRQVPDGTKKKNHSTGAKKLRRAPCCISAIVLAWFHDFLRDVIEEVPATVSEGSLQEGQSYLSKRRILAEFKGHAGPQGVVVTCTDTGGERAKKR